jgi:hypothetical protein
MGKSKGEGGIKRIVQLFTVMFISVLVIAAVAPALAQSIYILPTVPPAPADNFKRENMPDLGQHCDNWCWVAAAANVFKWYYHNGYAKLMDDPKDSVPDENYLQTYPCPSGKGDNLLRLLPEIAKDCLYPNVAEENENTIPWPITYCHPIDDNKYFLGLQKFIREQGVPLKVSEIIDNSHFVGLPENIPPENGNVVVYAKPTFDNYKNGLKLGNVLLQLPVRNADYESGAKEALDHIVTGVSYYDGGPGNQWILVSDPWTPFPIINFGPDHNDNENRYTYENLPVSNVNPLTVTYTGWGAGGAAVPAIVPVVKLIFISPIDNTPPGKPSLVSPDNCNDISDNTPTFMWTTVTDPSGVTYEIQIDNGIDSVTPPDFILPVYDVAGITENTYTLPDENALEVCVHYWWRVRATDGAGNIGPWSEEWHFHVVPVGAIGALMMSLLLLLPFALMLRRQNRRRPY